MIALFWTRLSSARYHYVLVNTLVSVLAFGRNLLFMRTLGLADLGQIALMQTIVMLIGFIQLGLINGTYIVYAERDREQNQHIVNLLWVGIFALLILVAAGAALGAGSLGIPIIAPETLLIGTVAGVAALASNWLNNALIAEGALGHSNIVNVLAIVVSLLVAAMSLPFGLPAALLSILLQPLITAVGAVVLDSRLRPNALTIDRQALHRIFSLGIMPFLASLFVLMSYQVERWAIVKVLGSEALGRFYIVMMYMSFFLLVPVSLMNMHFSAAAQAVRAGAADRFRAIIRRHTIELLAYCVAALIATTTVMHWLIVSILPQFASGESLVLMAFPAMSIWVLRDSASLALYSTKNTRPILYSGAIFIGAYALMVVIGIATKTFSLSSLLLMRALATLISTIYLFWARRLALKHGGNIK